MNKVSTGTIVRTICLALALLNQILNIFKINPIKFEDEQINTFVTTVITIVTAIVAWWKNNSITKNAIEADKHLKEMKQEENKNV